MTTGEARNNLSNGCRRLSNLTALLQVMAFAAEAQGCNSINSPDIDWWGLLDIATEQAKSIHEPLDIVESFLDAQSIAEKRNTGRK